MPQFAYSAINAQGNELTSEIQAATCSPPGTCCSNGGLLAERIAEIEAVEPARRGRRDGREEGQAKCCRSSRASSRR